MKLDEIKDMNIHNDTKGEKSLKKKVAVLESNLQNLHYMYHELMNQSSGWKNDNGMYEKKLERKNDRIKQLEKDLAD